jgi:alpha-glucosidase
MRRLAVMLSAALLMVTGTASPARAGDRSGRAGDGAWPVSRAPVEARIALDDRGALSFGVAVGGEVVLAPAPIGIVTEGADLSAGLTFTGRSDRTVRERYTMTTGKRLKRDTTLSESAFAFTGTGGTRLRVVVRVSEEGAAYRYELGGPATVLGEASSWSLPAGAPAWLLPYTPNYEETRVETTAGAAATGEYGYPSLFRSGRHYALLTESGMDGGYDGSRLVHRAGLGTYTVRLADEKVAAAGRTPWRVAIVGDLATVTGATLVDDLAPPSKLDDTSWVRPGLVAWSWLSEHASPADPVRQKQYIDFAVRNGWPYVLIDEGWDASWVPEVVRYARARGVEVLLWFHWTSVQNDEQLALVRSWGVAGVKIDFMDSDEQARFRWYDWVLPATAAHHLMVNFHGATVPRGLQRTWPHVMTAEAVRGAEQFRTRAATNTIFPFTRNVVGGMDYTPVTWAVTDRDTTDAHEVALAVVYESGWTHPADKPETYQNHPEALRTLDQLPTVWDDTRLLGGEPGRETVIARRSGDRWWLGGISAVAAHDVAVPLDFLGTGRYLAETLRDGAHGLERESHIVRRGDTLTVPEQLNGGFVTALCPYTGKVSCDRELRQVPATTLALNPATADVPPGGKITVTGTFTLPAGGPLRDVTLAPTAPPGWKVTGPARHAAVLRAGASISGSWTFVAGPSRGYADLPVAAEYSITGDPRRVHVEQVTRALVPPDVPTGDVAVSDLPFLAESNGWGPIERDSSNGEDAAGDGHPITIAGTVYPEGLGTHAPSEARVWLGGACTRFTAEVGLDDEVTSPGSVTFELLGDGATLATTPVVRGGDPALAVTAAVTGVRELTLRVTDAGDGKNFDHADWAAAALTCA